MDAFSQTDEVGGYQKRLRDLKRTSNRLARWTRPGSKKSKRRYKSVIQKFRKRTEQEMDTETNQRRFQTYRRLRPIDGGWRADVSHSSIQVARSGERMATNDRYSVVGDHPTSKSNETGILLDGVQPSNRQVPMSYPAYESLCQSILSGFTPSVTLSTICLQGQDTNQGPIIAQNTMQNPGCISSTTNTGRDSAIQSLPTTNPNERAAKTIQVVKRPALSIDVPPRRPKGPTDEQLASNKLHRRRSPHSRIPDDEEKHVIRRTRAHRRTAYRKEDTGVMDPYPRKQRHAGVQFKPAFSIIGGLLRHEDQGKRFLGGLYQRCATEEVPLSPRMDTGEDDDVEIIRVCRLKQGEHKQSSGDDTQGGSQTTQNALTNWDESYINLPDGGVGMCPVCGEFTTSVVDVCKCPEIWARGVFESNLNVEESIFNKD